MDFRKLRFMKNSRIFSRFAAIFLSVSLVTVTCLVYDMVIYAMETAQSEAVTDVQTEGSETVDGEDAENSGDLQPEKDLQEFGLFQVYDPYMKEGTSVSGSDFPENDFPQTAFSLFEDDSYDSEESADADTPESDLDNEVSRITYKTVVETEVLPCKYTEIPILYVAFTGKYSDIAAKDGEKEVTKRQKYIDGELVEEVVVSEKIIEEPVNGVRYVDKRDELIDYGDGAPTEYTRKLEIKFTAYTYGEVGGSITATGEKTRVGYVAVDRNLIPMHSLLYIVTDDGFVYGYCYAKDVGGGIKGNRIDVFLPSVEDMRQFGVRTGTCYVIREGK